MALFKNTILGGKKSKSAQPFVSGKKRNLEDQILQARIKLETAKKQNDNVIKMELQNIRYNRNHKLSSANEARYMSKIKNAYYSMSVIENTKLQLNDIETTQELYSAMNNVTDAIKIINQVYNRSSKPKTGKFVKQSEKLEHAMEDTDVKLGSLYHKVESIDDLVSNDVVERLLKGDRVEECLREEEGIKVSMDELMNFDWDEVSENFAGSETEEENTDFASMDFSDFS